MNKIKMLSIFKTVDGECNVWGTGHATVFVRTGGCTVGCVWCDTKYSWSPISGVSFSPNEVFQMIQIQAGDVRKITLTGGEPLEQDWAALYQLMELLISSGYRITVETSGTQNTIRFRDGFMESRSYLRPTMAQLTFVVDYKLNSSGYKGMMDTANHFQYLRRGDAVKFVLANEADYYEALAESRYLLKMSSFLAQIFFSPCYGEPITERLLAFMKIPDPETGLDALDLGISINLQMHKHLLPKDSRDEEGGGFDFTKRGMGREAWLEQIRKNKAEL